MISAGDMGKFRRALPFWVSLTFLPLVPVSIYIGGWAYLLVPIYGLGMFSVFDYLGGFNLEDPDPDTDESTLYWYRLVTILWPAAQVVLIYGALWAVANVTPMSGWEKTGLMFGVGLTLRRDRHHLCA